MSILELNVFLSLNIQKARWKKGLSLSKAANFLRVDIATIESIEANPIKVPLKDLFKIVRYYEVPEEVLWHINTVKRL